MGLRLVVGIILFAIGIYFLMKRKNRHKIKNRMPSTNGLEEIYKND